MKAPIHSTKHYVQITRSTAATVARNSEDLILSVEGTVANAVDEVVEGAIVKAIYIELWLQDAGAGGSFVVSVAKYPSGIGAMTFANSNSLGTYSNKKNILYVTQGLTSNDGITGPINLIRTWFKIPKSKQRFGLEDKIRLTITNNGPQDLFYCGFATYKEYT